jgi:hypothetical protein
MSIPGGSKLNEWELIFAVRNPGKQRMNPNLPHARMHPTAFFFVGGAI